MRMDLPRCGMTYCRFYLDGNCINQTKYEQCELTWYKSLEYKYRWHNLTVDTEDLPAVSKDVDLLAIDTNGNYEVVYYDDEECEWRNNDLWLIDVSAWRYIKLADD